MNKPINMPIVIAVIVVVLIVIGVFALRSGSPAEGKRPDASAGGIQTPGGKVLPVASGTGGGGASSGGGGAKSPSAVGAN